MKFPLKVRWLGCALLSLTCGAWAQTTIDELHGEAAGDRYGEAVAFIGDVNGDGAMDFAVGAPGDDDNGLDSGSLRLYSGLDRTLLRRWDGALAGWELGGSVDSAGDVDHDSIADVIVGQGVDQVLVFSGASGAVIHSLAPNSPLGFGTAVSGLGDVDGDGWVDLAVGSEGGNSLWVFSGQDGSLIWNSGHVALAADAAGDIDGDGLPDLITGNYMYGQGEYDGIVRIHKGLDGTLIRSHQGQSWSGAWLGHSVCGVGDLDGDGRDDYAMGAPAWPFLHPIDRTYAEVRSGVDGALIHRWEAGFDDDFGWSVANAGDMNLDGTNDVLVSHLGGHAGVNPSKLHLYSGLDGATLFVHTMVPRAGHDLDAGEDVDGDGWLDILAGTPEDGTIGADAGKITLLTLGCPPDTVSNYCTAVANSTGQRAKMGWQNSTSIANNNFRLSATKCPPNKPGLFFYGTQPTALLVGEGLLCVTGATYRLPVVNTGSSGAPSHTVDFTSPPNPAGEVSAGETWYFSFWFRDPLGGPAGFNFADGLRATFCP